MVPANENYLLRLLVGLVEVERAFSSSFFFFSILFFRFMKDLAIVLRFAMCPFKYSQEFVTDFNFPSVSPRYTIVSWNPFFCYRVSWSNATIFSLFSARNLWKNVTNPSSGGTDLLESSTWVIILLKTPSF